MSDYTYKQIASLDECIKHLEFYKPLATIIGHKPSNDGVSVLFNTSEGDYIGIYRNGYTIVRKSSE